jgi:hypothetical protein
MKKTLVYFFLITLAGFSCQQKGTEVSESAIETVKSETAAGKFGADINDSGVVTLTELVAELESKDEFSGKVVGEIKEVCSKKGCWMTIDLPNGQSMRVTFKDYGFFVPLNSSGYPVVIEGIATKKVTDVETLRHYAEDAGKSKEEIEKITESKNEYAFEAVGVIIKENA